MTVFSSLVQVKPLQALPGSTICKGYACCVVPHNYYVHVAGKRPDEPAFPGPADFHVLWSTWQVQPRACLHTRASINMLCRECLIWGGIHFDAPAL